MDQIKFSLKDISEYLHKWMVVALVLVLVAANGSRAATEVLNEPPPTVSVSKKNGPMTNLNILIVVGCVLIPLLLIIFSLIFIRRCAEKQLALAANTGYHSQTSSMKIAIARGLDPAIIATFTSFMYSTVKEIKLGQHVLECVVCLNEFTDHETLRLLPECSHVFHRECIDEWLGLHVTCPVCRASLVPKPNNEPESYCGPNVPQNSHVSIKVTDLKHDILPSRKITGSYSMGHWVVRQPDKDVQKYTLRLPEEISYSLKNSVTDPSTSHDVLFPMEDRLKNSLKSASANFVRGSD